MLSKSVNEPNLKKVLRNSASLIITRILTKVAITGLTIVVARQLGDVDFGVLSTIFAFTAFFSIIEEFGLTVPMIRKLAKRDEDPGIVLGRIIYMKIPLGIISFILFVCTAWIYNLPIILGVIFGANMFFEIQAISIVRSFEGLERMEYITYLTIIEKSFLCLIGIGVLLLGFGLAALGFVYLLSNIILITTGIFIFQKKYSKIKFQNNKYYIKSLTKEALPFILASLFSVLYNRMDIYFLTSYRTLSEVGLYNAAYRIIDAQMFIPVSIVSAVFPPLARCYSSSLKDFYLIHSRSFYFLLFLGICLTIVTYFMSTKIITLLYGEKYLYAVEVLKILSFILPFYFLNYLLGSTLIAVGREIYSTISLIIGATLNMLLNYYFIGSYGINGIALAKVISEITVFIFQTTVLISFVKTFKIFSFTR
ncbi:MAG: flippase [Candidatus Woesearchaeota archaeon]